ncbi:hypothetical protein B7Y94_04020 [Candidatus Saccharibacteria bacterium 32-49-12]|nr:MAG: hypothetical protein B7Y94_04020 [Candidatus Saccharibacteria bacterium 32-49-12]
MSVVVLFGSIIVAVFTIALLSGRRFGPLALALSAGSMLAEIWADWLTVIVSGLGFEIPGLPYGVVSTMIILLGPLFLLLFGGPRYYSKFQRILSAVLIALLTAALLVIPLGRYMTLDGEALNFYKILVEWWQYVVTVGLVAGLVDLFLLHSARAPKEKKR